MNKLGSYGLAMLALFWCGGCNNLSPRDSSFSSPTTPSFAKEQMLHRESAPFPKVWKAVQAALKEMDCVIVQKDRKPDRADVVAQGLGSKTIYLTLVDEGSRVTSIYIRVGATGDDSLARVILAKIKAHL